MNNTKINNVSPFLRSSTFLPSPDKLKYPEQITINPDQGGVTFGCKKKNFPLTLKRLSSIL
jgi:hypothetical protein